MAAYQITMRVGWIFKTESIIMPAVMDLLCGPGTALAAWMRSWLPQLNRFGQSVPQLLFAKRLRDNPLKKTTVFICSGLMGGIFLTLSATWYFYQGEPNWLMRIEFLICYASFFICVGVNNLGFNTLQGKLIRFDYRGRLFLFANMVGGSAAILTGWFLLNRWLTDNGGNFAWIFGFAGVCFLIGSVLTIFLKEDPDKKPEKARLQSTANFSFLQPAWNTFLNDTEFRKLAILAGCFGCSMILFPHYQALYRESVTADQIFSLRDLILWVMIQNTGTVIFGMASGPIADRFGNRFVLRLTMLVLTACPVFAIWLASSSSMASSYFFLVFLIVGITPVIFRVLNNFSLELASQNDHPNYLSALSICIAIPVIVLSQIAGWLLPILGYEAIFFSISMILLVGWLLTFNIREPRKQLLENKGPV